MSAQTFVDSAVPFLLILKASLTYYTNLPTVELFHLIPELASLMFNLKNNRSFCLYFQLLGVAAMQYYMDTLQTGSSKYSLQNRGLNEIIILLCSN